jgi:hypothetical protein
MSNNHSLERGNLPWSLSLVSNILIVLGLLFIANWVGGSLMYAYQGRMPVEADFMATGEAAIRVKKMLIIGQIGGTVVGMIILPLLYVFYIKKELSGILFNPSYFQFPSFLLAALSITIVALPMVGIVGDWNKQIVFPESMSSVEAAMRLMEDKAAQMTKLIVDYQSTGEMLVVIFTVALLPAVSEELVFRGILQNDLVKSTGNIHVAVFASAAIFSFIHFQFFGFFPRMILGIILGYLYITSGNLWVSMLMHFTNNALVVVALNLHQKGMLKIDPESSKDLPLASIYVSVAMSLAILYYCWSLYKQRTNSAYKNV